LHTLRDSLAPTTTMPFAETPRASLKKPPPGRSPKPRKVAPPKAGQEHTKAAATHPTVNAQILESFAGFIVVLLQKQTPISPIAHSTRLHSRRSSRQRHFWCSREARAGQSPEYARAVCNWRSCQICCRHDREHGISKTGITVSPRLHRATRQLRKHQIDSALRPRDALL